MAMEQRVLVLHERHLKVVAIRQYLEAKNAVVNGLDTAIATSVVPTSTWSRSALWLQPTGLRRARARRARARRRGARARAPIRDDFSAQLSWIYQYDSLSEGGVVYSALLTPLSVLSVHRLACLCAVIFLLLPRAFYHGSEYLERCLCNVRLVIGFTPFQSILPWLDWCKTYVLSASKLSLLTIN